MSDLVLSNLTIQGHPVGLFYDDPTPSYTILDTVIEGNYGQYCWVIPIDVLINCQTNNLVLDMTAYTTETGTGGWDGGHSDNRFFALRTNGSNELDILTKVVPWVAIDSNGYRGMTISDWSSVRYLSTITNWKNNYGDTNVWLHAPAMQSSKFLQPPECRMTYTH